MRKALWVILALAFALRTIGLSDHPPGFTPDEASFGYDAYSILKTGKDQWGKALPLVLESHGDYKAPLYSYLTLPSVAVFGLNKFSVRLPNAILGTLAVFVTYLLFRELLKSRLNHTFGLIAAILLSISPWHIMMSRGAFEANLTTFLLPLGVYLFLKGLEKSNYLIWSALILGTNLFSYHSAKLVTPLITALLVIVSVNKLRKVKRNHLYISLGIFSLFLAAMLYTFTLGAGTRAKDVSIFQGALQEASPERLVAINKGVNPKIARLLHNKYQVTARRFISNYQQYFSLRFLFTEGPAEGTYGMFPGMGVLYWFELPLLLGFVYYLYRHKDRRTLWMVLFWLLVAPIPASLTMGRGFAGNRTVIMLPAVQLALTFGAFQLYQILQKYNRARVTKATVVLFGMILLQSLINFTRDYFVNPPPISAKAMLSGNLEAASWLIDNVESDQKVIISRRLSEPQIYIAFAARWDPTDLQLNSTDWVRYRTEGLLFLDQLGEYHLGNYTFGDVNYSDRLEEKVLLVGRPEEFPEDVESIHTIYYPNGEPAVLIVSLLGKVYA